MAGTVPINIGIAECEAFDNLPNFTFGLLDE